MVMDGGWIGGGQAEAEEPMAKLRVLRAPMFQHQYVTVEIHAPTPGGDCALKPGEEWHVLLLRYDVSRPDQTVPLLRPDNRLVNPWPHPAPFCSWNVAHFTCRRCPYAHASPACVYARILRQMHECHTCMFNSVGCHLERSLPLVLRYAVLQQKKTFATRCVALEVKDRAAHWACSKAQAFIIASGMLWMS